MTTRNNRRSFYPRYVIVTEAGWTGKGSADLATANTYFNNAKGRGSKVAIIRVNSQEDKLAQSEAIWAKWRND